MVSVASMETDNTNGCASVTECLSSIAWLVVGMQDRVNTVGKNSTLGCEGNKLY